MIRLYDYALSGNCYKVRLLLELLAVEHETVPVDFYPGLEHKAPAFLEINPLGQLPVLEIGEVRLRDAQAILVHLAASFDASGRWYPSSDPSSLGPIQAWLSFGDMLTSTLGVLRLHHAMFMPADVATLRDRGRRLLRILEQHLWFQERRQRSWLWNADHPTVADLACFPYIALSEEAETSLVEFPAIVRWCERIIAIEGFRPMAGMLPVALENHVA